MTSYVATTVTVASSSNAPDDTRYMTISEGPGPSEYTLTDNAANRVCFDLRDLCVFYERVCADRNDTAVAVIERLQSIKLQELVVAKLHSALIWHLGTLGFTLEDDFSIWYCEHQRMAILGSDPNHRVDYHTQVTAWEAISCMRINNTFSAIA
jgi:hypothetical protein